MFDVDYLIEILEKNNVDIITRRKHSYIMYQGIESDYIFILKEGVAKISSILKDGGEFNIAYVSDLDFVSLLEEERSDGISSFFNVRVESETADFYRVPRKLFWTWINNDFRLFKIVDDFYRRRLAMSLKVFQNMTVKGKKGAVCAHIYNLIDQFGIRKKDGILIDFPETNEDIAGFCGISSRTSVNRILHDLKAERVIDIIDNHIMIYDASYLKQYVD